MPQVLDYTSLPKRRGPALYAALAAALGLVGIVGLAVTLATIASVDVALTVAGAACSLAAIIGAILTGSRA